MPLPIYARFIVAAMLLPPLASSRQGIYVTAQIPWHAAVVDAQGKLLAWYEPEKNLGYDHVVRLGWDFIEHRVPKDSSPGSGPKIYLANSAFAAPPLTGVYWQ